MRSVRSSRAVRYVAGRVAGLRRSPSASELQARLARYELGWEPGHFYSPIPDLDDIRRREATIFRGADAPLAGIDLREEAQLALLGDLGAESAEHPWGREARAGVRYRFENPNFQEGEALVLLALMRLARPRRVIEVGSGYSSCALLDVNDRFLDGTVRCTFIEPYPELLHELVGDKQLDVRPAPVQEVPLPLFDELGRDDMLIIDSTHVAKVGSDVNHLMFEVLPRLAPGVLVHVHDIFQGFEYSREWVYQGRAWNEAYVLRAFLMFNSAWEIVFFNSYIAARHPEAFAASLPPAAESPGASLWLRRRGQGDAVTTP
jgi:predicted O-methyltransferase YrrM